MRRSCLLLALSALSLVVAPGAIGQGASFEGLGDLAGGGVSSVAMGVSADGSVVVGRSTSGSGGEAFRWTAAGGMVGLGDLPGGLFASTATAVSADGAVVVGHSRATTGEEAFRWTGAGGIVGLGFLSGGVSSFAFGVSADGSVAVGLSNFSDSGRAFRWTAGGGMVNLGTLDGGNPPSSNANGTSADGSIVVGQSSVASGAEAYRWTAAGGMVGLGDIPTGSFGSSASAVSADGNVVVGESNSVNGVEPFRWTSAGGMQGLGFLTGCVSGHGRAVSADGSVVVGTCGNGGDGAFVWTAGAGMRRLRDVLVAQGVDMTGWTLLEGAGVSADGRVIVGLALNPQGSPEAFRAVLAQEGHRWIDPTGGSWEVASNWSPATVPGPNDDVRFDLDATYIVTGGTGALGGATARAMGADDGTVDFELGGLALTAPGLLPPSLSVSFDATAKIIAGTSTFVNASIGFGSNTPGDTTTTARLQVFNAGTQLTGSGNIYVGDIDGGRGELFVAAGSLRNFSALLGSGAIGEAIVGNGGLWTVDNRLIVGSGRAGRIHVEEGGSLSARILQIGGLNPSAPALVDVAGVGAAGRSRLFATDSLVVGRTDGSATLRIRDGADVAAGHLTVRGDDNASRAAVVVGGAVTQGFDAELTATSLVVGEGGTQLAFLDVRAGGAVDVERFYIGAVGSSGFAFISGGASLLVRAPAFAGVCEVAIGGSAGGVLSVRGGGLMSCDRASVGTLGDGRIFVGANGATASQLTVSRVLKVGEGGEGQLDLAAGTVDAVDAPASPPADPNDVVVFAGGVVQGTGTVVGAVSSSGTVAPGVVVVPPPLRGEPAASLEGQLAGGALQVSGRIVMESGSTLAVAIAGADSTLQGRLRVVPAHGMDGSAALGGTLRLDFQNAYAPNTGDTFLLLDAASTVGTFEGSTFTGLEPGWQFEIAIADGRVVLNSLSDGVATTFPTPAEPGAPAPAGLVLHAPAPNPAAGSTTLRYELPAAGRVRLALYDMLGREVAVLVDGDRPAGAHEALLQAGALAPGVYVARLAAGVAVEARRLTVAR